MRVTILKRVATVTLNKSWALKRTCASLSSSWLWRQASSCSAWARSWDSITLERHFAQPRWRPMSTIVLRYASGVLRPPQFETWLRTLCVASGQTI
eukprot:3109904-Amphidinium_carterae.1